MNASTPDFKSQLSAVELTSRLDSLKKAYHLNPYPSWEQRKVWLQRLSQVIFDNKQRICDAINQDFGYRSPNDTLLAEVFPSLEGIRHAIGHGKSWMKPKSAATSIWFKPAKGKLMPQPLGVVGIMVPWNYPLLLAVGPLTNAITAGNRAFIKMSEYSPNFSILLDELLNKALGADLVQVINGEAETSAEFSRLPFDHLIFTGSTPVGRMVMKAASENLVPVTLELGGKSPAIVSPDMVRNPKRFHHAVARIMSGKSLNAGQTCIAPDYVLIPRGTENEFLSLAKQIIAKRFPDGVASKDLTGIVSDRHYSRLQNMLVESSEKGGRVEPLMKTSVQEGRKIGLTLVFNSIENTKLMQEEIFGPLMPIISYDTLDEALEYVRARPRPLALYLFDDNASTQEMVMRKTIAGGVCLNDTLFHIAQDNMPFGGVGDSGMGHYHGKFGFDTMSKLKPIFIQAKYNSMELLAPPYGKLFSIMTGLLTRKV
ncbi:MAG: coniferyl aldehyde dehydrogenase [Limnobacter sp.]|nr:coniferyl aldehyde dehydrogenase [Limnobacter sp.]